MGKTKIKTIENHQSPVLSGQTGRLSASGQSVVSQPVTDKLKTGKPDSENRKQKTDNRTVHGQKYQKAREFIDPTKKYPLKEAVELAQKSSYTKFPGTLEAHLNTTAKNLRGLINLPYFSGKKLTILAFGPSTSLRVNPDDPKFQDVIWGTDETIEKIIKGPLVNSGLHFDVLVATPEWMPKLAKAAKILGPKGLMPNPKSGTVTDNLEKTITELKAGKVEFKTEKDSSIIHLAVGKTTQDSKEIAENIKVLYNTVGKSKITKITLSATMGPGVKVELGSI